MTDPHLIGLALVGIFGLAIVGLIEAYREHVRDHEPCPVCAAPHQRQHDAALHRVQAQTFVDPTWRD